VFALAVTLFPAAGAGSVTGIAGRPGLRLCPVAGNSVASGAVMVIGVAAGLDWLPSGWDGLA
jgi:hypothetical protein